MRIKKYCAPTLLAVLFCTVLIQLPLAIADRYSGYDFIDPIMDIRGILAESYVKEPDEEAMQLAAINAMIETLGDQHTVYIPPARERDFNKNLRGTYVGIGAEVQGWPARDADDRQYEYLTIISPMDDSPALEGGVLAGDIVLEIEGESTFHMPVSECIDLLLGEPDTQVSIKVQHVDETEEIIVITRRRIVARTVRGLVRNAEVWHSCVDEENKIYYVRVTQFNSSTLNELFTMLKGFVGERMKGLILDLRGNPGGGLPAAIGMADMFLSEGEILSVRPRKGRSRSWHAKKKGTLPHFPMIVMVNGSSASASEIVAGALQDNGRAKVLGTRTFGKGSVQEVRELEFNRGTLKYTNAYYYLPSGRNLNKNEDSEMWGVDPDPGLVIAESDEAYVEHVLARRPFEVIKAQDDALRDCFDPEWIRENFKDEQLASAVEVMATYLTEDRWMAVTDLDPAVAAFELDTQRLTQLRSRLLQRLDEIDVSIARNQEVAEAHGKEPLLPEDVELIAGTITRNQKVAEANGKELLLPKDVELIAGTITLRDKDGNVVGQFRIEGGDPELALSALDLSRIDDVKNEE